MLPTAAYAALKGFPWGSLQVLSTGDDQNPTPLTGPVDDGGNPPGAQGSPPPGGTPPPPGGTPPPPGGTPPPPAGTPPAAGARPAATAPQPPQGAAPRTSSPRPTDTTAPTASLSATQTQTLGRTLVLKVKCASERCVARAGGAIRVPKVGRTKARTLKLKTVSLSIDQGTMATIKLSLSAAQRHAIKRASREHKAVRATLTITVADTAGNTRTLQQTMRLKLQS
jgi:hypothetical protein